jgi:hypothetical protein
LHPSIYGAIHFGRAANAANKRFDDPLRQYGVLYAAEDEFGSFAEVFLRNPDLRIVARSELDARTLSRLDSPEELRLVDLTGPGLQKARIDPTRLTGDYEGSQSLSREIFEHPEAPDGIRYRVKHDPNRIGVALFERPGASARISATSRGGLLDAQHQQLLAALLEEYEKDL